MSPFAPINTSRQRFEKRKKPNEPFDNEPIQESRPAYDPRASRPERRSLVWFGAGPRVAHGSNEEAGQVQRPAALLKAVREATQRFKDVNIAKAEGYVLQFG